MRLKGFRKLTSIDAALQKFFGRIKIEKLKTVTIPVHQALNRVLAEDIIADKDLPGFDRSAMDGYAVRAEDTFEASQFKPKLLQITEEDEVGGKQAKQVWTGDSILKGASAVIMLENTKRINDEIEVWVPVTPGENISKRGEDISKGDVAVKAGTRLKPQHLGLIAALGITEVKVVDKPKIAILATGNELITIGNKPRENQIFEVNRLILSALCQELGAEPFDLGIAKDDVNEISEKLKVGLEKANAIITTGGTSVGASDLVPASVNRIGKPGVIVHGIAMRPAMPTALAIADKKPIIILSGNPVAAMIGFEVFARPLICKMLGLKQEFRPVVKAKITRRVSTVLGRKSFVRVHVSQRGEEFFAQPVSTLGSGVISTMTKANGYVVVPENRGGLEEGELVTVHLFDNVKVVDESV
ncbi:MAG: molybdopterin molybdotransferase MoeA [Candidatus Bathyarchaeota archaeon]|nr:molybdopterin molybdotransferase MoeA [Candidatus Bathyarchaeota archaeon]